MAELEKVIKGLEEAKEYFRECRSNESIGSKAENHFWELQNATSEAAELLKAQEPRVIDADEIVLSAEPSKWLWVERKGDYCTEAYKAGKTVSGLISFGCETPGAYVLYCERPDEYGKTWRCWTSRPDDKRRYETPWES